MAITKVSRNLLNTGVSDSSDATAITITSDEKVGVGVTTPENYTFGTPLAISAPSGANSGLTIVSASNSNGTIAMADGTSGVEAYRGFVQYSHLNEAMFIGANGATVVRLDAHGLKFGSDSAAANALDDYEEGTWTPTVSTGIISTVANSSEYTKIGEMVFAQTRITGFSDTSSTNYFILGGLPYSVGTTESHIGTGWGNFSQKTMFFYYSGNVYFSGAGYAVVRHSDLGSTQNILISLIYRHG